MKKYIAFLVILTALFVNCKKGVSQNSQIDCNVLLAHIESLLAAKDSLMAIHLYEGMVKENCKIKGGVYLKFSRIYYDLGEREKSKCQVIKAVENGVLSSKDYSPKYMQKIQSEIQLNYGEVFLDQLLVLNLEKRNLVLLDNKTLIDHLNI